MLSVIGAISLAKWLLEYLGLSAHEYHLLLEWLLVVVLITIDDN